MELELAISSKDRDMELLEDNHRVELRVYQQKVKHLEYEHRNNLKAIALDGTTLLDTEAGVHDTREKDLIRVKEQLKSEMVEMELVNASKIAEMRQQLDKQIAKLRQQFEDGLSELSARCESRQNQLETELELRRRVEVHEVEERKNQHINDLIKNHKKAFGQMKSYYNDITGGNLQLIRSLQKQVEELKSRAANNKKMLLDYIQENQKLSEPLSKVSAEIAELQTQLKERAKDQMALENANSRLSALGHQSTELKKKIRALETDLDHVQAERDEMYVSYESALRRIEQQAEFHNQGLESKLVHVESLAERTGYQVEEIIRAANLDPSEMARVADSLKQMLVAKNDTIRDTSFLLVKLKKAYNDSLETFYAKLKLLGIPQSDIDDMGFRLEKLVTGSTSGPADLVAKS
jgi:chromosome segregation ATPase